MQQMPGRDAYLDGLLGDQCRSGWQVLQVPWHSPPSVERRAVVVTDADDRARHRSHARKAPMQDDRLAVANQRGILPLQHPVGLPGRTPRGARPLSLTMFVLTAVSSINTSRAGSSIPCSRIQRRRARATSARCRSAACSTFFERDVVSVEKTPERAAAGFDPSLAQFCNRFYQGQVRPLGDQIQNLDRELFQRRNAPAARLRGGAPLLIPALQPPPTPR